MFGIDGIEFIIIILVAVLVIGPKDMPKMLRAFAQASARMRALAQEFRGHFDDALREADMRETADSLRQLGDSVKDLDPRRKLQEFYASLERETELEKQQRTAAEDFDKQPVLPAERAEETPPAAEPVKLAAQAWQAKPDGTANAAAQGGAVNLSARKAVEGA